MGLVLAVVESRPKYWQWIRMDFLIRSAKGTSSSSPSLYCVWG
ncbi:hypothetical protein LINPERHAP1_LOCUS10819 [Linum perenne]